MDQRLRELAPWHLETKFLRLDSEKAPFFVKKLQVRGIPWPVAISGLGVFFSRTVEQGSRDGLRKPGQSEVVAGESLALFLSSQMILRDSRVPLRMKGNRRVSTFLVFYRSCFLLFAFFLLLLAFCPFSHCSLPIFFCIVVFSSFCLCALFPLSFAFPLFCLFLPSFSSFFYALVFCFNLALLSFIFPGSMVR